MRAVTAVLARGDAAGRTTDDIADALNLPEDSQNLQTELEVLVRRGILDRRGIGRGALYTLSTAVRVVRPSRLRARARDAARPPRDTEPV